MKPFKPNAILITGGAGFIGHNFILHCYATMPSIKIINVDKLTYASNRIANENFSHDNYLFVQGDICDTDFILSLLREHQIDAIINFAAESHVDRSITNPLLFAKSNVLGTASLLEAARHYWLEEKLITPCRFYQISTDEVYGSLSLSDAPSTENQRYQPSSPYSASKAAADHFVTAYYHTYGLPVLISHCSNNYGPYQHAEKFIPTIINACFNWNPIPIYGNGNNVREWIHVEDHCNAIHTILTHGAIGECYNIGSHEQLSNNELAKNICALMDKLYPQKKSYTSLISYVSDRLGHDFRYALDSSKIKNEFNWQATTSLADGLTKTIEYYKNSYASQIKQHSEALK